VHHRFWLTDDDPVANLIKQSWFKYLFRINLSIEFPKDIQVENYRLVVNYGDFLYKYRKLVLLIWSLLFIWLLGMGNYVAFYLIPIWYVEVICSALPDIIFHHDRDNEKDVPWMMPIWFSTAWHITHHGKPNHLYYGPGWVKYFNLQYWVTLLFFDMKQAKLF
jgi:hypothetical protein